MTQFADAQMYEGKVGSGSDAVNMAINMSHLLGHYDPKSLMQSLDTFNKYSTMEPGSSTDLYSTLKYLAPSAKMLNLNETSTMQMAALANRVGLTGTHGGTSAADMILRLIPGYVTSMGGKPAPAAMQAMQQLGMVDSKGQSQFFDSKGQITNFPQMIQTLINDGKKFNPEELTKLYGHVFGAQGGKAASLFSNPQMLEQLQGMTTQLSQTKSIGQIQ
jgi:TP901 family phage tail tape measure protein